MAKSDDKPALKITLEDLAKVEVRTEPQNIGVATAVAGAKQYGNIAAPGEGPAAVTEEKGHFFLQGWFYLGVAGLLGALVGWGIGEPFIHEGGQRSLGDVFRLLMIIPLVLIFMCLGFSIAESIVERSLQKALQRAVLSFPLGLVFSVVFMFGGGIVYRIGLEICSGMGIDLTSITGYKNPAVWIARGFAWMVFAAAAGIVYGLVDRSMKKGRYGVIGAVIGGGVGGVLFDPISLATKSGGPSRGIGFALIGIATGVAIGIVESALKDRWLYVASGPLAGKQFILYKPITSIGSSQKCDIYLFKDNSILPQHGSIEVRGAQ
ncbi:MAG TPA: FHA domain-containing protein, partial [Candidatus Sulfotelmatobacter sp.]|nr:FHA domain-containing protein [Candidatus Sulfotelmatobacter sp.]